MTSWSIFFIFVSLVKCSCCSKFHVNIITGSGFMTIFFMRDWLEIWRLKIPPPEFFLISGDWGELGVPYLAHMSLIKGYCMLQNARVTAFTISELLRENQQGYNYLPPLPPPKLGLKMQMAVNGEVSIIVWLQYITLKLF